jgi:nucleotide-binding universal stress UspA family protein
MYERIEVAIDGSEAATDALREALRLANQLGSRLRLIYVVDFGSLLVEGAEGVDIEAFEKAWCARGQQVLEQGAKMAQAAGIEVETVLLEAEDQRVSDVIAADAASWHADLLVVGTRGRHGISRLLLGSVAEGVARASSMPVLLVRHR